MRPDILAGSTASDSAGRRTDYRRPSGQPADRPKSGTRPRHSILVVDDDWDTRQLYTRYLAARGFRVQTARDGVEALAMARLERPDVIVMDLSMPHVDGVETTRRLKAEPTTARIPVIACTGRVLPVFVERALEAGCAAYLVKPCLPKELLAEIRKVLRLKDTRHHGSPSRERG